MKSILALLATIAALAHAPRALAGPKAEPAIDHYEVGKRLFELKYYKEALGEFRRALSSAPRPEVLYSMAQTQRLLGDCPGAIETYRAFLASGPGEPFGEYARLNIERCQREAAPRPTAASSGSPAWYRDVAGDLLVGGGLATGVIGAVMWRSGRSTANHVADAPDYPTFLERQRAASSALTEQRVGIAVMSVGAATVIGGVLHYVHFTRARGDTRLGVSVSATGAMLTARGAF